MGKEMCMRDYRLGEKNINYQGCLMEIQKYNNANDIYVEFQDDYKGIVHGSYRGFRSGKIKNPYYPEVYGIGRVGVKYKAFKDGKDVREYQIWNGVLQRCYDVKTQIKHPAYAGCTVSDEWINYENFYDWIHEQDNFEKWNKNEIGWSLDKDILLKGNRVYSSNNCCLVPESVNALFTKRQNDRGDYPIGVYYYRAGDYFRAQCMNPLLHRRVLLGKYNTPTEAFYVYKKYKEDLIKEIAKIELEKGNIIEKCYEAMINYEVEITD